jgi:signal transduction histidine kinase
VATAETAAAERRRQSLAATEAERTRWARELHDETLQGMASLRLLLSAANKSGGAEQMKDALNLAVEQLDVDIANLRGLIADLRPATLDQLGLEAGVRALVERRAPELELDIDVDLAHEQGRALVRLAPEVETAAYRIVQEALTNAIKHGGATRASLELLERDAVVTILVRDNGSGFDPSASTDGFGLIGMHERVELLGGKLELDSTPGRGTTVTATLPARHMGERAQPSGAINAG